MRCDVFVWLEPGLPGDALLIERVRALGVNETARQAALAPATLSRWLHGQTCMAVADVAAVQAAADALLDRAAGDDTRHITPLIGNVAAQQAELLGVRRATA